MVGGMLWTAPVTPNPFEDVMATTVTLPLEVMGPDGYTKTITVDGTNASQADTLWLQTHSIAYPYYEDYSHQKASVSINGGSFIKINDSNVDCYFPANKVNCIGGPRYIKPIAIPASGFTDGQNDITFKFRYASAADSPDNFGDKSSGYRILDIELRDANGNDLLDNTSFSRDPWGQESFYGDPPDSGDEFATRDYDTQTDIDSGAVLWNSRNILTEGWDDNLGITASCSDCHAENARDLQYFAYTNKSIYKRAKFHDLTDAQSNMIAAWVRSYWSDSTGLKDRDTGTEYSPPSRPWHPVFQPGTTSVASRSPTDARSVGTPIHEMPSNGSQYAAAGAGYKWMLQHDSTAIQYMFPGGPSDEDFQADKIQHALYYPHNIPHPDWNEWLPEHFHRDMTGTDFKNYDGGGGQPSPWKLIDGKNASKPTIPEVRTCISNNGVAVTCLEDFSTVAQRWIIGLRNYTRDSNPSLQGSWQDMSHDDNLAFASAQLKKWGTVRIWNAHLQYDMGDEWSRTGDTYYFNDSTEVYTWPGGGAPFDLAPHVTGTYAGPKSSAWDVWLDTSWYEVAVRMNNGRGYKIGNRPVDWTYATAHTKDYSGFHPQPARLVFDFMKAIEVCQSHGSSFGGGPKAWIYRHGICGNTLGNRFETVKDLDKYRSGLAGAVWTTIYNERVEWMMYASNPNGFSPPDEEFVRKNDSDNGWAVDTVSVIENPSLPFTSSSFFFEYEEPTRFYHTMDNFYKNGNVRPTLLDSSVAFLDAMNPDAAWNDFRCSSDGGNLDCTSTGGGGGGGKSGSSRTIAWGNTESSIPFAGEYVSSPQYLSADEFTDDSHTTPGNRAYDKFYTAAPPNSQADSFMVMKVDSTVVSDPGQAGWQGSTYSFLAADTTSGADGCRIHIRGDLQRRAVRTWCSGRGYSNTRWFYDSPVSLIQFYRGGYIVNAVQNQNTRTLLDSMSVALPDTARSGLGTMNMGTQSTTVETWPAGDFSWTQKQP